MEALKYFSPEEFIMGQEVVFDKMDTTFLHKLDELRELVGTSLIINSSYRSKEYNEKLGGAKFSFHLLGRAVDIKCLDSVLRAKIVKHALNLGLSCGVYNNWVHVDNRDSQLLYKGN